MRTLVSNKCANHAHLKYVVMSGARVCCTGHTPEALCSECREAARYPLEPPKLPTLARSEHDEAVPPPPSLLEAIFAMRGERKANRSAARVGNGLTILPSVGTNPSGVPNAPRLVPAVRG